MNSGKYRRLVIFVKMCLGFAAWWNRHEVHTELAPAHALCGNRRLVIKALFAVVAARGGNHLTRRAVLFHTFSPFSICILKNKLMTKWHSCYNEPCKL